MLTQLQSTNISIYIYLLLATKICPVVPFAHVTPSVVRVPEVCVVTSLLVQHDLNEFHPLRSMSIIIFQYKNLPVVKELRNRKKRGQFSCKQPKGEGKKKKKIATSFKIVVCFLLGDSPASEFNMPTFRNTLFHLHRQVDACRMN